MSKTKEIYLATFPIEANTLEQTLALLTEIHQRTGFAPSEIKTPAGTRLKWDRHLAIKVSTGKTPAGKYTEACTL